jgi:hypothetical protein
MAAALMLEAASERLHHRLTRLRGGVCMTWLLRGL